MEFTGSYYPNNPELGGPDKPRQLKPPTKAQRRDFADAHAEGLHDDSPREFCPECEREGRRS